MVLAAFRRLLAVLAFLALLLLRKVANRLHAKDFLLLPFEGSKEREDSLRSIYFT